MQRRLITFLMILLSVLPLQLAAEDEIDSPTTQQEALPVVLHQPCYMRCLDDGYYAHICQGICEHPSSKTPEKVTNNQYECYQSCTQNNNWGVLFCMKRCRKWAETLESQDIELPPEQGVQ
jgi:hypothetical protein